ncbi:hypothetical protein MNB_SUP05-SYMBIONT-4-288 [hydrothermal vent metagenome]|uniref:Uncharacterized protein n=1 Tax=hydrothermal vent metagenome TaxID=652676 RepID=A0A1W1DTR9_9ZZZZ
MPPSSAGFSFFIKGNAIKLRVFYNAVNFLSGEEKDEKNQSQ